MEVYAWYRPAGKRLTDGLRTLIDADRFTDVDQDPRARNDRSTLADPRNFVRR